MADFTTRQRDAVTTADSSAVSPNDGGGRIDVVIVPRTCRGEVLLTVGHDVAGQRFLVLPLLQDRDEDDGWRSAVVEQLNLLGVPIVSSVRLIGAVRADDRPALIVVAEGCCLADPSPLLVVGSARLETFQHARDIRCKLSLAALAMLRDEEISKTRIAFARLVTAHPSQAENAVNL